VRRYGRAARGQQVYGRRSGLTRPRPSLIAARVAGGALVAPFLLPGTCDTGTFHAGLETYGCPLLNDSHVVVLDNARFHQSDETRALIQNTGALLLCLPPYSPERSPGEPDCANLKHIREDAANQTLDQIVKGYH
jgi:hypothetical protein